MFRLLPVVLGFVAATAVACGGNSPPGAQPSWRQSGQEVPGNTTPPPQASGQRAVLTEAALQYNSPPRSEAPRSALSEKILQEVARASASLGIVAPVPDGRLYAALHDLAALAPTGGPVSYTLIEFALQRHGIIEPSPNLVIIEGDAKHPEAIVNELKTRLPEILSAGKFGRVGLGVAKRSGMADLILLAFQETHLSTKAIARELPASGSTVVEGAIASQFSDPHIYHTGEDGKVVRLPLSIIGAKGFRTRFSCESRRGKQQLEITASDRSGSTVLANFPIWCGTKAPQSIPVDGIAADPPPATREEAEARMLVMVNQDRAKHGLGPLLLDSRLIPVGRRHSDEMLATGEVAHVSPTTGSAGDRVRAGNIRTAVVLENVARAYGVGEAELGLMNSPGHRANILSPEVSHIGIGITLGEEVAGRRELLVTQVFILIPGVIDPSKVHKEVVAKVLKTKRMTENAALRNVAQVFASSIARGMSTQEASNVASVSLDQNTGNFSKVSTLVTTVSSISTFKPEGSLGGPKVRFFGVGVAQGNHPVMGDGAIYLVILLGQR